MKLKINWKKVLLFVIISGGLIYLTKSFLMSLGILLILFVIDGFLRDYDEKHKKQ